MFFKYLKLFIIAFVCILSWKSYGYFEYKYFCSVDGNAIEVSIATGDQKCFPYLEQLSIRIDVLDEDILKATAHIKAEDDITYRQQVEQDLREKRQVLENLRKQFLVAIDDYEKELFLKIKSLVGFYLMPEREKIVKKIQQAQSLLFRLKLV